LAPYVTSIGPDFANASSKPAPEMSKGLSWCS
jgi:hypothetical protein